jgi:hypothetical protein
MMCEPTNETGSEPMTFKVGDIIRYSGGSSALAKLDSEHAGGFHAVHCMGGYIFVSESYPRPMQMADEEDVQTYNELRAKTLANQNRKETK